MLIQTTLPNINVGTFESILNKMNLALLASEDSSHIRLDITSAGFIDPYSITGLLLLLRYLHHLFPDASMSLSPSSRISGYLNRIRFFQGIPRETKIHSKTTAIVHSSTDCASDILLEVTPIRKQDDIHRVIDYTISKIARILKINLGYNDNQLARFCTALGETCQNILDHSRDSGLVTVQKYTSRKKTGNYVIISVGDLGIGIKRSLSGRYDTISWNHARAIESAILSGTSRFFDRGRGLYRVAEIVRNAGGIMVIRSGSGWLQLTDQTTTKIVPFFPGTQIYIRL